MEYVSPYVIAANKAATNRTRNAKAFLRAERQKVGVATLKQSDNQ